MSGLQKILREPLLHFLVLGAGLFVLYGVVEKLADEQLGSDRGHRGEDREFGRGCSSARGAGRRPRRSSTA